MGNPRHAWWLLLLVTLLAHGHLLLNDTILWDSHLIHRIAVEKDWGELHAMYSESGLPPLGWTHRVIGALPRPEITYKVVTFFALWMTAWGFHALLRCFRILTPKECLLSAALAVTWPAYAAHVFGHIMTPYHLCVAAFLWGWVLLLPIPAEGQEPRWGRHLAGAALVFYGFTINSLLVFHGSVWLLAMLEHWRRGGRVWKLPAGRIWLLLTMALPVLFWSVKEVFWPRHGLYGDYNRIGEDTDAMMESAMGFLQWGFAIGFVLVGAEAALVLVNHARVIQTHDAFHNRMKPLLLAWVVLALGAMAPYVLAARIPDLFNQESRHLLLVGFAGAVMVLAILRARPGGKRIRRIREWAALAIIVLGVLYSHLTGVLAQHEGILQRSVVENLRENPQWKPFHHFELRNSSVLESFGGHRFYTWSHLFLEAWGEQGRVAIPFNAEDWQRWPLLGEAGDENPYWTRRFAMEGFPGGEPDALLLITTPPTAILPLKATPRYQWLRFFGGEEELREFLLEQLLLEAWPRHTRSAASKDESP